MIIKTKKIILILIALITINSDVFSQQQKTQLNRILFVFDASQSMLSRWQSGRKIDIAKKLLVNMTDSLRNIDNLELGLRVYGHQSNYPPQDCNDTRLEINFLPADISADMIKAKLKMINAKGTTPIAKSLEESAKDFPDNNSRNIIILITDGKEECGMDPCSVSRLFAKKGIILKPFVIGIGLDESWKENFDCVGTFFDASNEKDFSNILNIVISHVIDNTTTQVNLLDSVGNPTETNVSLSFYDNFTDVVKYNYLHTMNSMGNPDTMIIDPVLKYNVVAHTIPPVTSDLVTITPGSHTIIPINTPQGTLEIKLKSKINYSFLVKKSGENKTLNVQEINTLQKYLTGYYDIELLTIPRINFDSVRINQSSKTTYSIPPPGLANIILPSNGYGGVYLKKDDKLEEIYSFKAEKNQYRLTLLPGNYVVVFRSKSSKKYLYTSEKEFKIKSGKSQLIKIY